jgi:CTP-dependent riboflavin kinase
MQEQNSKYFKISQSMLADKRFSTSCCVVYGYMLNKQEYFKTKSKNYFESQQVIADSCGLSKRTVVQCIEELEKAEYIKTNLIRVGSSFVNTYSVVDIYKMYCVVNKQQSKYLEDFEFDEPF